MSIHGELLGHLGSIYVPYMSGHKYKHRGRGVVYTCVFMFGKHKIGLNLRLKNPIFMLKQHIFLCLCVFRNAPILDLYGVCIIGIACLDPILYIYIYSILDEQRIGSRFPTYRSNSTWFVFI